MEKLQTVCEQFKKHGFEASCFETAQEAKKAVLERIGSGSVGFGGSVTVDSMGVYQELKEKGNSLYWHWKTPPAQDPDVFIKALTADFYLCSANALLTSGAIVNIDGTGNRVAAIGFAKNVIIIAGKNKLVEGCVPEALERIKSRACGANGRRLGLKTPCAVNDKCADCSSPQRMCKFIGVMERPCNMQSISVYLVNEDLGY